MKELERVRWRCRRGMLELDIVLGRFVETRFAELDDARRRAFDALLEVPDATLWDMIMGRGDAPQTGALSDVLELIRTA